MTAIQGVRAISWTSTRRSMSTVRRMLRRLYPTDEEVIKGRKLPDLMLYSFATKKLAEGWDLANDRRSGGKWVAPSVVMFVECVLCNSYFQTAPAAPHCVMKATDSAGTVRYFCKWAIVAMPKAILSIVVGLLYYRRMMNAFVKDGFAIVILLHFCVVVHSIWCFLGHSCWRFRITHDHTSPTVVRSLLSGHNIWPGWVGLAPHRSLLLNAIWNTVVLGCAALLTVQAARTVLVWTHLTKQRE